MNSVSYHDIKTCLNFQGELLSYFKYCSYFNLNIIFGSGQRVRKPQGWDQSNSQDPTNRASSRVTLDWTAVMPLSSPQFTSTIPSEFMLDLSGQWNNSCWIWAVNGTIHVGYERSIEKFMLDMSGQWNNSCWIWAVNGKIHVGLSGQWNNADIMIFNHLTLSL